MAILDLDLTEFSARFEPVRERGMPFDVPEVRAWFGEVLSARKPRWDQPRLNTVIDKITGLLDLQYHRSPTPPTAKEVARLAGEAVALALKYPPLPNAQERFARRQAKRKVKVEAWTGANDAAAQGAWLKGGDGSGDAG
jgi:hypothetical protein